MKARRIVTDSVAEKSGRGRWLQRLAAVLAAAHMVAACTETDTITLGASVQLTGNLSDTGRIYRDAYQFAVDRINAQGGVMIGEKPHKLALKVLDNKSDPKLVTEQHERLLTKDRVNFLLGPFSSNAVLAGAAVAEKYQVPMVQGGGASSRIFLRGYKYVFGTLPVADDYFRSTIDMLGKLAPKAQTVGMVSGDDSFDVTLSSGTMPLLKKAGLQIVLDQQYSERVPNFFNILTLIQSRAPDVLLWSGHEASAINFIRASKRRNVQPKLLASFTVGVPTANFRTALGKDADYAFGMTPWLPSDRLKDRWFGDAGQFTRAYEGKFGYAPDYHAAAAAAAVEAQVMAIEAAGTLDPKQVRDAIARLDFESLYGRIHFGRNGQIAMPQTVIQIQDGKVIEVFADKFVNQPLYPVPAWDKRS
jgi:branched-chain amino acid transport system substrate-binding protein